MYSLIVLIQDFGGFNDGVTLIPAIIMTFYNAKMFNAAKASVFPIKRKQQRPKSRNKLQEKFALDKSLEDSKLSEEEIRSLNQEASLV